MNRETITISTCCREKAFEDFKENPRDHHDPVPIYRCSKCQRECEVEDVCAFCLGTGEITVDEPVYAGEPHMAPIGTRTCSCQKHNNDEHDN